jgi:hypothetical protein
MRRVWPHAFTLYAGELTDAFKAGLTGKAIERFLPTPDPGSPATHDPNQVPVALRWSTTPLLGFPRQPFEVWRRGREQAQLTDLLTGPLPVTDRNVAEWGLRPMYEVQFVASPDPGQRLTVDALDAYHQVIPGQRINFTAAQPGRLRCPGIAALLLSGRGSLATVRGISLLDAANAPGWQRIEVVGLPLDSGEIGPPAYDPEPQGLEPPSQAGTSAARLRLAIARFLHVPPPDTGVPGLPAPPWPGPDPDAYLKLLRGPGLAPVPLIQECLEATDDTDPARLQADFLHEAVLGGIRQADLPGAAPGPDPTVARLPVVATSMLSTSSDSYAASGLGYGTVDFPPKGAVPGPGDFREPPGTVRTAFDYMVTTTFLFAFGPVELAALAQPRPAPDPPANLAAASFQANRAPGRDLAATESVTLSWDLSALPQGYGVAVSRGPGTPQVLNAARPSAGGFDPFIPLRPGSANGDVPARARTSFTDPVSPLPLAGTSLSTYLVIGLDVFGRWSPWGLVPYVAAALPVTQPGLHTVDIQPAAVAIAPDRLRIEFSWDWSDRSPDRVEFTGRFFPATATPDPSFTGGFALAAAGPVGPPVVVRFDVAETPVIASAHTGTMHALASDPPDPDRRKYLLEVSDVAFDFTAAPELAYAVYARGAERVRPAELSAVTGPVLARVHDPFPPSAPPLPVDLTWTALPDAASRARGLLTWPASARATGYIVWEATESALRNAVDPAAADPAPGTSLPTRAAALHALVTASVEAQARSLQTFARLTTRPIPAPRIELELPGSADSLYAYRVSSISAAGVESERSSTMALFAVPRRNQPGQPTVLPRVATRPPRGIHLIVLPGPGATPAGYRVHRVRSPALLNDVGLMGPPAIAPDDPGWADHDVPALHSTDVRPARAILDQVAESWHPYYYRVVALGVESLANGEYAGESLASAVQSTVLPPAAPPLLDGVSVADNATNRVATFTTDLPVRPTPLGAASVQLVRIAPDPTGTRMARTTVLLVDPATIAEDEPLAVLDSPTTDQLDAMPEITRGPPDAQGRVLYTIRVRAEAASGAVVVRDPLGRSTERQLPEVSS